MADAEVEHSGAMVALVPSEVDLDRLALPGGEPRDELHLTLAYLGDAVDLPDDAVEVLRAALGDLTAHELDGPVHARAFGVAYWNPDGPDPAWVLNVGDDYEVGGRGDLDRVHDLVSSAVASAYPDAPNQHSPWQPHVCLAYGVSGVFDQLLERLGPVTFDRIRLAVGGSEDDFVIGSLATIRAGAGGDAVTGPQVEPCSDCDGGEDHFRHAYSGPVFASDAPWDGAASRFTDEQYQRSAAACDSGDGTVKERCFLPHHEPEGALNVNGLHAAAGRVGQLGGRDPGTVSRAKAHLRSHYREVGEDVPDSLRAEGETVTAAAPQVGDDGCGDGYNRMPDGSCMTDEEMAAAARWTGVLCVEGTPTGDGREFSPEALDWADHMLLRWQKEGSHGGDHDVTVTVGRIDRAWRDGPLVRGEGTLDLMNPDGFEVRRQMAGGFAGGVSIDADDIEDADVELVWPENMETDEDDPDFDLAKMLFANPEKVVYHGGRVRAATLVDIPAFVEAHLTLVDGVTGGEDTQVASAEGMVLAHSSVLSDGPWSYTVRMHRELPNAAFAWVSADGKARALPHHELAADGLGPANLTACASVIGQVASEDSGFTLAERRAAYAHVARHLRDAGQVPPPVDFGDEAIVAGAATPEWRPPVEWFADPKLTVPLGLIVTDEGRVYGHAAHWSQCHIGYEDVCVSPPHEPDHPYFMTGEVVCADGSRVAVGQITVGIGHAPPAYGASRAAEHYDNTSAVVADVAVGNDEHGIWVAGAVRPHAESRRVYDLRASGRVSGDWRRIGGALRLVGLLGVNVGGFLMPSLRTMVSSGVQTSLVAAGIPTVGPRVRPVSEEELDRRALRLAMNTIASRVRGPNGRTETGV